ERGHVRHSKLDRAAARAGGDGALVSAFRCWQPARDRGRRRLGAPHRRHGLRQDIAGRNAVAMALCRGRARARRERAARSGSGRARDLRGRRRGRHRRRYVRSATAVDLPPRRPHHGAGIAPRAAHVPRRRRLGGPALYLVEFRVFAPRADGGGKERLEDGALRRGADRDRVHPAAAELAWNQTPSWPGLSRPSTSSIWRDKKTWMPATIAGMTKDVTKSGRL